MSTITEVESLVLTESLDISNNINILTVPIEGNLKLSKNYVALSFLSLYYSWRNITSAYNNNSFSYIWNATPYTVTLPDGNYEFSDINSYLQNIVMFTNGHYLVDGNGNYVYYLSINANQTYYATTIVATVLPATLPAGWSDPNSVLTAMASLTPQLVIPSNNFTTLTGFTAGTYPSVAESSTYSINSQTIPEITPVTTVFVMCDIIATNKNAYSGLLYAFSPSGVEYGSLITISLNYPIYYRTVENTVSSISIKFYDQNMNPLGILDKEIVVQLLLK